MLLVSRQYLFIPVLNHPNEKFALVSEEAIDAAFHDTRALGDVGDQCVVVALLGEHGPGSEHDVGNAPLCGKTVNLPPNCRPRHYHSPFDDDPYVRAPMRRAADLSISTAFRKQNWPYSTTVPRPGR